MNEEKEEKIGKKNHKRKEKEKRKEKINKTKLN
jgi:hypothetical protein